MRAFEIPKRVLACLLLLVSTGTGQMTVGANTQMTLSGDLGANYDASFSDIGPSGHGTGLSFDGYLNGHYFNPAFLSFSSHPYYNRTQNSAESLNIGSGSGYDFDANLFSGSNFPISFGYGTNKNTTGQFAIPGAQSLVSVGSGHTFVISSAALIPGWPSLVASFSSSATNASVLGIPGKSDGASKSLSLYSTYTLAGFTLNGNYSHNSSHAESPEALTGGVIDSSGGSSNFGVSAFRQIPLWQGAISMTYGHGSSKYGSATDEASPSGQSSNTFMSTANFQPLRTVSTNFGFNYDDNLSASIAQRILSAGGVPLDLTHGVQRSMGFSGSTMWAAPKSIHITAGFTHREQSMLGLTNKMTRFFGNVSYAYAKPFMGSFLFNMTASDAATQAGNTGGGLTSSVNYTKKFHKFHISAGAGYSQNVETLVNFTTGSGYNYNAGFSRKILHGTNLSASFSGSHSGFSTNSNGSTHAETDAVTFSRNRWGGNFHYSQSHGLSFLTSQGLVANTTGAPDELLGPNVILFDATSYGMGGNFTLFRKMQLSGSFSRSHSLTSGSTLTNANESSLMSASLRYPFRKMFFNASFAQVRQGAANTLIPVPTITSYTFGFSRYFRFF